MQNPRSILGDEEYEKAHQAGDLIAEWLEDLVRSKSIERPVVERRITLPVQQITQLMERYLYGPEAKLTQARMRATGTRKPMNTHPPEAAHVFVERVNRTRYSRDVWVDVAHSQLVRQWVQAKHDGEEQETA